jgi:hypothetical protein
LYTIGGIDADWKLELHRSSIQEIFMTDINYTENPSPIIKSICAAMYDFKKKFCNLGNNYRKMRIFGERLFKVSPRNNEFFDLNDLNSVRDLRVREKLSKLTVSNLCTGPNVISINELERLCDGEVPVPVYSKLRKIVIYCNTKFEQNIEVQGVSLNTYFNTWKKGSKKFRNVLINDADWYVPHNIMKFAANAETVIGVECAVSLNKDWTKNYYSNKLRTFIFKLHGNTLPLNTMLSHFVRGISRNCTFCSLVRHPDPEDETMFHIFYDCATTEELRITFFKWLTSNNDFMLTRHDLFCCGPGVKRCETWVTICYLFLFFIWEHKLRKSIPQLAGLKKFIFGEVETMKKISLKFTVAVAKSGLDLSLDRIRE